MDMIKEMNGRRLKVEHFRTAFGGILRDFGTEEVP
jgi:hypothetical protein